MAREGARPAMNTRYETPPEAALYARIGGTLGVSALVDAFYRRVLADPLLGPMFAHVPMVKLKRMQLEFFSAALGGPVEYTGRPIIDAHHHLHLQLAHYQRFVRCLMETLEQFRIDERERYEIIGRLNLYTEDVVGAGTGLMG